MVKATWVQVAEDCFTKNTKACGIVREQTQGYGARGNYGSYLQHSWGVTHERRSSSSDSKSGVTLVPFPAVQLLHRYYHGTQDEDRFKRCQKWFESLAQSSALLLQAGKNKHFHSVLLVCLLVFSFPHTKITLGEDSRTSGMSLWQYSNLIKHFHVFKLCDIVWFGPG